jgi:serine protease Do
MKETPVVLGVLATVLALGAGPAMAQTTPSPIQQSILLAAPAVVLIETNATIRVELDDQLYGGRVVRRYNLPVGLGSGFAVNSDGTIVTANHIVEANERSLRRSAVERMFAPDRRLALIRAADSLDYARRLARINRASRDCLAGTTCDFTVRETRRVYLASRQGREEGRLESFLATMRGSASNAATDVAVIKITPDDELPTVALADTARTLTQGDEIYALGYPETARGARGATRPQPRQAQFVGESTQGGTRTLGVDGDFENGMSGGPAVDATGRVIGLVSFVVLQRSGESGTEHLRTIDDIRAGLADAGARPARGTVDTDFTEGMNRLWKRWYTDAQDPLRSALDAVPGHIQARDALAVARRNAGTDLDESPSVQDEGFPWWGWVLIALGVLAVLAGLAYALLRGRGRPKPAEAAPVGASVPERGRTVISTRPSATSEPTLVIREGPGAGQRFAIKTDTLVGREDADVILDDAEVSRRHALIRPVNGRFEISDLRSANGTRVNGSPVDGVQYLADGDVIELGRTKIAVELPSGTATSHRLDQS